MAKTRTSSSRPSSSTRTAPSKGAPAAPEKELLERIPVKYRSVAWIGILLLSLLIFFAGPIFSGEYFASNDNISWESYRPYLNQMAAEGESPQWMPYIFSGMPGVAAYMVTGERGWDISVWALNKTDNIFAVINFDVMRILFFYFILGMGVFFLARSKGLARPIAFFSSFAVIFSTWIIVWIMIGHNTKPMTLAFLPWVILFADKLIQRWSLLYAGLLILAVHFIVESAHPQTAFYCALLVGIWLLSEFIASLARKENGRALGIGRAALIGLVAGGFAYGMGMDRFNAVFEYNDYSTRGPASIIDTTGNATDAKQQYEYATSWSYDVDQTFTYVVPAYFGFGKMKLEGLTQKAEFVTWGNEKEPFTDAAHYIGIIVLLLSLYGAWHYRKTPFVVGLFASGIVGLLLAWGGNFPVLYDIFYSAVPMFNKFRAPGQALVILEFAFPILAGFGLQALIARRSARGEAEGTGKKFLYATGAAGLFLIIGFGIKSSYIDAAAAHFKGNTQVAEALYSVAIGDWIFASLFVAAFCILAWLYLNGRIKGSLLTVAVTALTLLDLWRIDYRAMNDNVPKEEAFAVFNESDVDKFLKQDSTQYRIADVRPEILPGRDNHPSYPAYHMHQHIGGYSAAKMRRYQDLMDVTANGSTQMPGPGLAWDILNTKYILASQAEAPGMKTVFSSQNGAGYVFENPNAMPRAWFVDRVEVGKDLDVLTKIKEGSFNPWEVAYVPEALKENITPATAPGAPGSAPQGDTDTTQTADSTAPAQTPARDYTARKSLVKIASWKAHELVIDVEAPGTNFLVVSEIYYPVGWHATIDGKPAETIRTNYLLRGLVVPPGKHQIKYEYRDEKFEQGKTISMGLNLLMLAAIAAGVVLERRRKPAAGTPAADDETDMPEEEKKA